MCCREVCGWETIARSDPTAPRRSLKFFSSLLFFYHATNPLNSLPAQPTTTTTHPKPSSLPAFLPPPISPSSSRVIQPRKPQKGHSIVSNHLRPHVAAADHLFSWDTPFGIGHRDDLARSLPEPLVNSAFMAIKAGLAPNTKSTYAAGLLRFTQFCDKWNIAEEDRMPANYAHLCAFAGEHKGLHSGNTICSWLAGLHSWHIVNHAPWHGNDSWVQLARISANKEGTKHKWAIRAPVSIEHLSALRRAVNLSIPFHAAVFAVALCTFFGCRRLGETTVTTAAAFALHATCNVLSSTFFIAL
jgi:hypothetical protein